MICLNKANRVCKCNGVFGGILGNNDGDGDGDGGDSGRPGAGVGAGRAEMQNAFRNGKGAGGEGHEPSTLYHDVFE